MVSPRILRIIILLLSVAACASLVNDQRVYDIDRFNIYLSFALMGSYFFSLVCQYRLVNKYPRAFLMILLAFIWLTVNTCWIYSRYIRDRDIFRTDVSFAFPTSLLVVIEAILTPRYESQLKKTLKDQESGNTMSNLSPSYRQTQEMMLIANLLRPAVLPPDEQDNLEITLSPIDNLESSQSRVNGYGQDKDHTRGPQHYHQLPARVYRPPSSLSSASASESSSSSSSSQSTRNRVQPVAAIPNPEILPPYSQV
ncbi:MAG: hypothetical protein JOS17DRAFT_793013 [Linnemannia elongata]|nr:MAG: hypothetical protein JOS17DRAFT_793013 [Linnemannia elongata]